MKSSNKKSITDTKGWLERFVIGLNLCPFAHRPYSLDLIRYCTTQYSDIETFVVEFYKEALHLRNKSAEVVSTTLLIIELGLDNFEDYLDVLATCEDVLEHSELAKEVQLASFHPEYQFAGTDKDDVTNYTNRSPYPVIHLLRTDEMSQAISQHGNTEQIPIRNQKLMKELEREEILKLIHNTL